MIQKKSLPIALVFPPQGHFTQPYLALPCIQAWLEQHGFDEVELIDASVEAYDAFLTGSYLEKARDRVGERLGLARFEGLGELGFGELEAFRAAAESAVSADLLIEKVDAAKAVVRGEGFYDTERYVAAVRTLYHSLRLVSAAHFPSQLTPHNFTMGYANDRSAEVLAALEDEEQNPFLPFYREEVLPRLVARRVRLVGLSVIYGSQLIPALTLGKLIKEALPDCHVTAGGGFLAYIGKKLMAAPGIEDALDSLVFYEGEGPMLGLAQHLSGEKRLEDVGSIAWFDRSGARARAVFNGPAHPVKLDEAPLPDFTGLPFEKYFSPEVVLPYDINRGCYYGECTFCTLPTVIGPGYRTRSAATIVDHVLALRDTHGVRHFNFITDCMPPGMIRDLPDELIERRADIRWWCDARVEPKAYDERGTRRLYEAGCRKLLFGFETATPRLLKMMKKGQSLKSTVEVARRCTEAGISVTFYAMVGFPSETREEARSTLDFLIEHKDVVREVSLQTFHIDEVAQTYRSPEDFGIEILGAEGDLALYHDYLSKEGMTQREAAEMFEEMMGTFRAELPIFSGDNIYYFMLKSHYFLHLARDLSPERFVERCAERTRSRLERVGGDGLAPHPDLRLVELPFGYQAAVKKLGHPLARAVRPDFLTGRFVEGARAQAEAELGGLEPQRRVLAYVGGEAEFVELSADGRALLQALAEHGSLGALRAAWGPLPARTEASLERFARDLHRLGVLRPVDSPTPLAEEALA